MSISCKRVKRRSRGISAWCVRGQGWTGRRRREESDGSTVSNYVDDSISRILVYGEEVLNAIQDLS